MKTEDVAAGLSSLSSRRSKKFEFQKFLGHDYKRKRGELETCSQEREPAVRHLLVKFSVSDSWFEQLEEEHQQQPVKVMDTRA